MVELPEQASRHALRVLRMREGDAVFLFNGNGEQYEGELLPDARGRATVRVLRAGAGEPPPPLEIHLALGVSRGQRMDMALQKATELGVTSITPLFTRRGIVRLDEGKSLRRRAHWRQVIVSACEQSGRCRLPALHEPAEFADWLAEPHPGGVLLDPGAERSLANLDSPPGVLTLAVGPEGGLSAEERRGALAAGFSAVRLGPRILRTETAPLAAIAAAQVLWGDFR